MPEMTTEVRVYATWPRRYWIAVGNDGSGNEFCTQGYAWTARGATKKATRAVDEAMKEMVDA